MANTFTPLYNEVEDRILLIINYNDVQNRVDFMITRSFILKILPAADEFLELHYLEVQESINEEAKEELSQTNKSETDNDNLEFFSKEKELLQELNFSFIADKKSTTLTFASQKSLVVASLDYRTLKQLIKTVKASIPHFTWGISLAF